MKHDGLFDPAPFVAESDTSRARAQAEDAEGITVKRRVYLLTLIHDHGVAGMTWKELSQETGLHHGQVSAVLSTLHKQGRLFQNKTPRDGSHPYIHANFRSHFLDEEVNDEPVKKRATRESEALETLVEAVGNFVERGLGLAAIIAAYEEIQQLRN